MKSFATVSDAPQKPIQPRERRVSVRHVVNLEALSRPLEVADCICWGATVQDISQSGLGLLICYPFKAGTYLAVDVCGPNEPRTLLSRVVHVADQSDGTWSIGCELVHRLSEAELEALV